MVVSKIDKSVSYIELKSVVEYANNKNYEY